MKKLNLLKHILLMSVLIYMLCGCDADVFNITTDSFRNSNYTNDSNSPISTYLASKPDFSEYVKLLNYSDMFNALNQSTSGVSFTAFAPTNEAMKDFYKRCGVDSLTQLSKDYAKAFVLYHTVEDSILPDAFVLKSYVKNLSSDKLNITIDTLKTGEAWLNNQGHVVQMGLSAYNGKIYVLSKAMTPLVETIYDRLTKAKNSEIMRQAVDATGWKKQLSAILDTTVNKQRERTVIKKSFTFLNVTDDVFVKNDINSLNDLKKKLKDRDSRGLSEDSLLREYVAYHILDNAYTIRDFCRMTESNNTRIWNTSANNQVFSITYDSLALNEGDRCIINSAGSKAGFITGNSDLLAKNGYIHELDSWLPVYEPSQARIIWDLADYPDIKNLVSSEYYQPSAPTSSEYSCQISSASCFNYEMGGSGTNNHSYGDIDYVTCKSNLSKANNLDRVVFNVGYMGSVEMKTPTIIKGKYKVELTIVYLTDHDFMRQQADSNGGLLKISFDNMTTYTAPYTKVTSASPGVYTSTIFDQIEFNKTASHSFKLVVLDPAASTNSHFSLQIDCITFIPVKD
ncbi:MAG: DUF5108 domain-containing protein [Prevotella sp.]|jgi:uncharacterized surface protein with fasciclin (FAS1) repeats|nr:DUF5108 domain-containing protein [Prevotella sp.]MCH4240832.1 DUF5108 domain-containing protein [Prevotella sp.]